MANGKKSFVLYADLLKSVDHLTDEELGKLFKHILEYVNDQSPELTDRLLVTAWKPIERTLKEDLIKWEKQLEQRRQAGKKSAEVRKRNSTSVNDRKRASTDSVTVSVSDNEINNIDFSSLLDFINTTTKRSFKTINKSVKQSYIARLKDGYSKDDIKQAITNAVNTQYHKDNNNQYLTPEFFSRSATLDKYSQTAESTIIEDPVVKMAMELNKKYENR